MQCPKCQGPCWDNRSSKRNPKAPDFKCKDKNCDGAVWEKKKEGAPATKGGGSSRPEYSPAQRKTGRDGLRAAYLGVMALTADEMAKLAAKHKIPLTMAEVQAATFSQLNMMAQQGYLPVPAPEAPKPQPKAMPQPAGDYDDPPPPDDLPEPW